MAGDIRGWVLDEAPMDGYMFEIDGHKSDRLSIDVPVFAEDGRLDAFAVFRVKKDNSAQPTVYWYDILVQ